MELKSYEKSYNSLNYKNRNKQSNIDDFHMWCVDSKGNIKDNFTINHPNIKVIHKEWQKIPKYYKDKIEKTKSLIDSLSKESKIKFFKLLNNLDDRCLQYAVLLNVLYGYEIKVGSLGIIIDENKILWEYGNGLKNSDF